MDSHLPDPSTHAAASACSGAMSERTERHLRMLAELAEIGMALARKVGRQALDEAGAAAERDGGSGPGGTGPGGTGPGGDPGLVFARIARAVRQTVALEARLDAEAQALEQQRATARASREAAQRARIQQQKERVKRLVEDAISGASDREADLADAETLRLDLDERLEDPDVEAELGWRPIGAIFAGICQDLGIKADLSGFTDAELGFDIQPGRRGGVPAADVLAGDVFAGDVFAGDVLAGGAGGDGSVDPGGGAGLAEGPERGAGAGALAPALALRISLPTGPPAGFATGAG